MQYTQDKSNKSSEWDAAPIDNYPWLFIGSLSALESHHHLKENNITRVLTVARKLPIPKPLPDSIVEHCVVEIDDHPRANFLEDAAHKCCEFIDAAFLDFESYKRGELKNKSKNEKNEDSSDDLDSRHDVDKRNPPSVLVHCASGISRSATAILIWLMKPKREDEVSPKVTLTASETTGVISITQALVLMRKNRSSVRPNIGFMMQLQVLEKHNCDLEKAVLEWKENNRVEIYDLISTRRQMANDIHAKVDELEVEIQTVRLSLDDKEAKNITNVSKAFTSSRTLGELLRELDKMSDQLDSENNGESEISLPEDRVTKMIFKSARRKIEHLFTVLSSKS